MIMDVLEIIYLFTVLLMGVLFMVIGYAMYRSPPGKINPYLGYRTSRSMKDQASWDLSQKYSGKLMALCGLASLVLGIVVWLLYEITFVVFIVVIVLQTGIILSMIPLVEMKMKRMR